MADASSRPQGPGTAPDLEPGPRAGPLLFGPPERGLFGWYDPPGGPPRGCGVVLCNPIGDDAVRAHRPLRHLAARLARSGFAVLRFDFHGTGDSPGDERQPDRVQTWLEDVRCAVAALREQSGAAAVALVGLRLGATLAAVSAATSGGVDSLVLWGPYARGSAYVSETTRFHKMHRMLEPRSFSGGPRSRTDGEEAFGFLLTHATIAALGALDLRSLTGRPGRRPGRRRRRAGPVRAHGVPVERRVCAVLQFLQYPKRPSLEPSGVAVRAPSAPPPAVALPARPEGLDRPFAMPPLEEPIVFGGTHPLFGILHRPAPLAPHDPGSVPRELPPIVLASAGTVHRIGPHRFYVALARRWAKLGSPSCAWTSRASGTAPLVTTGSRTSPIPATATGISARR